MHNKSPPSRHCFYPLSETKKPYKYRTSIFQNGCPPSAPHCDHYYYCHILKPLLVAAASLSFISKMGRKACRGRPFSKMAAWRRLPNLLIVTVTVTFQKFFESQSPPCSSFSVWKTKEKHTESVHFPKWRPFSKMAACRPFLKI